MAGIRTSLLSSSSILDLAHGIFPKPEENQSDRPIILPWSHSTSYCQLRLSQHGRQGYGANRASFHYPILDGVCLPFMSAEDMQAREWLNQVTTSRPLLHHKFASMGPLNPMDKPSLLKRPMRLYSSFVKKIAKGVRMQ
ncbi:hypothetical protein PV04_08506 [Phialophora macrospora]|uniref:Uncharacterized protein n=1 Tax=Phialophora macrospora TaxID=1851006 RepID=A0A0D2DMG8_9EURO|nr:hypothetical protein PV04_08506 [Phialophora macrospora]